jgi:preprotein translocase subunit YajC
MIDVLFAQGPQGQPQDIPFYLHPMFLIGMMVLFWVIIILPMSRRQKREQQEMLANIKPGVKVVTSAGIIGKVVAAKEGEDEITIRSEDTRLRVLRSSILRVLGTEEAEAAKT